MGGDAPVSLIGQIADRPLGPAHPVRVIGCRAAAYVPGAGSSRRERGEAGARAAGALPPGSLLD